MIISIKTKAKIKTFFLSFCLPLIERTVNFSFQIYHYPDTKTQGITSRCKDGRHILFFDYDNQELKQVIGELRFLQEYFKLSTAYIFELDRFGSYHAIILDKFSPIKAQEILKESNCDENYISSIRRIRGHEWALRCTEKGTRPKPKLKYIIKSNYNENEISTAHKRFLEMYYHVPTSKYKKEDKYMELPITEYVTGNRI